MAGRGILEEIKGDISTCLLLLLLHFLLDNFYNYLYCYINHEKNYLPLNSFSIHFFTGYYNVH